MTVSLSDVSTRKPAGFICAILGTALVVNVLSGLPAAAAPEPEDEPDEYFPQQLSARDLLTTCAASSLTAVGRSRQRYCLGFVSGVEEAFRLLQLRDANITGSRFCVPAGTSARTLANTFIRHASGSGVDLDRPSAAVVLEALAKEFSC